MWWHDIKEMKNSFKEIEKKMNEIEASIKKLSEISVQTYAPVDIFDRLNEILDICEVTQKEVPRLANLVNPNDILSKYEKSMRKIEEMMLEFKGCISMARASLAQTKEKKEVAKRSILFDFKGID